MNVEFSKPKKIDGNTYICQLTQSKQPLKILFEKSTIISLKHNKDETNEYTLVLKNKSMYDFIFDLNTHIVDTVRKNYQNWFVSNMNPEFIDDYYSNPLFYNKTHGDLIKLKCIDGRSSELTKSINSRCDINITFKNLRFYKQKFILECIVNSCDISDNKYELIDDSDTESISHSEEEFPEPEPDEIIKIKNTYLKKLYNSVETIETEVKELENKKGIYISFISNLELSDGFKEIVKLCDQIENNCE
jgi:hypothetical protein